MDLLQELWKINDLLTKALEQFKERGREYAKAQRDYRVLLRKTILELRADGTPTTILSELARGDDDVAAAKEQEIITKTLLESCQEAINVYKIQLKLLQEQINKEYQN